MGVLTDSALKARKLAQAERLVVASPAYLARRGVPRVPSNLLEHDGIVYGQSSGGQECLCRRGTSETSVYLRTRLKLSAAEGVREAVLAAQGFAITSHWMFAPELMSGEVANVLDEWTLPPMISLGHLSLGPADGCKSKRLHEMVRGHISHAL